MTEQVQPELAGILQRLPYAPPEEYIAYLRGEASPGDMLLNLHKPAWSQLVVSFLREWYPLNGHLFPIAYHQGGVFACLHLGLESNRVPVVLWDIAADLAEQPFMHTAKTWQEYGRLLQQEDYFPLDDFEAALQSCRADARLELAQQLELFRVSVDDFEKKYKDRHQGKSFQHHADNSRIGNDEWRPERLAVQDHMIGAMTSRFNKVENWIDVMAFCTRDHTNFARGSATASLLVSLLCEWAATGAKDIRFLKFGKERAGQIRSLQEYALPYEVALLGWIMGAGTRPEQIQLESTQAEKLFMELTPFPPATRRKIQAMDLSVAKACLNIHKQVWTSLEFALLAEWCPKVNSIMAGEIYVGDQIKLFNALYHARAAALIGYGHRVIMAGAEMAEKMNPDFSIISEFPEWSYVVGLKPGYATEWRILANAAYEPVIVKADTNLVLVALTEWQNTVDEMASLPRLYDSMKMRFGTDVVVLGLIPDRVEISTADIPFPIVPMDEDPIKLNLTCEQRFSKSRRLRK